MVFHLNVSKEFESTTNGCHAAALLKHHQEQIIKGVATMVACTNLPAMQAENKALKEVIAIAIHAGQALPNKKVEDILPTINRKNIVPVLIDSAKECQKKRLQTFQNGFSSLSLDASTLVHRHFLDFVISPPDCKYHPLIYDTHEVTRLGINEYGGITIANLQELSEHGVKIGSIIGDNHPVQKAALSHWSPRSVLLQSSDPSIRAIRFFSCAAHTSSLMLERAIDNNLELNQLESHLISAVHAINDTPLKSIVGHCPVPAVTRWLSRIGVIDWILTREEKLKESIRDETFASLDRHTQQAVKEGINFQNFEKIRTYAHIIFPFYSAIKFFEGDKITQAAVFPITTKLSDFFESKQRDSLFETVNDSAKSLIEAINHYKKKLL